MGWCSPNRITPNEGDVNGDWTLEESSLTVEVLVSFEATGLCHLGRIIRGVIIPDH